MMLEGVYTEFVSVLSLASSWILLAYGLKNFRGQTRDMRLSAMSPAQGYRRLRLGLERALFWSMAERLIAARGKG